MKYTVEVAGHTVIVEVDGERAKSYRPKALTQSSLICGRHMPTCPII